VTRASRLEGRPLIGTPIALWHDVRLLHSGANALLALALAAVLAAGAHWLVKRPYFTLRSVRIEAAPGTELRHVSTPLLRTSALRRLNGNFFTVDLNEVRAAVVAVPWVRRAMVRRIWPDRLVVAIEEHRPLALWGDGHVVNTFGELYSANLAEAEEYGPLPEFSGPAGSESTVLARYVTIDAIPALPWDVEVRGAAKLAAPLESQRELAGLFRTLATLRTDGEVGTVDDWRWRGPTPEFAAWTIRMGSPRLAARADALSAARAGRDVQPG
jgi:hypothetical protein